MKTLIASIIALGVIAGTVGTANALPGYPKGSYFDTQESRGAN